MTAYIATDTCASRQVALRSEKVPVATEIAKEVGLGMCCGPSPIKTILEGVRRLQARAADLEQSSRKLAGMLEMDATGLRKIRFAGLNHYLQVFAVVQRPDGDDLTSKAINDLYPQRTTALQSTARHDSRAEQSTAQQSTARHDRAQQSAAECSTTSHPTEQNSTTQHSPVQHSREQQRPKQHR